MAETTSRVLALLNLLQAHRQWSGPELAARLEVTERTLRRDIERLRELGYRVEATRGRAGGYRLEAGSDLPPLLFTEDEAVTMAIGLRMAATQGITDGETTTLSALAKFEQVLPAALRTRVNALAGSITLETPRGTPISSELLGELALACRDHERIRFHYVSGGGAETDRVVEPHSLVAAERHWFFVCWDLGREDWRTFRVDRMSRFFGTRLHFSPRELPATDAAEFVAAAASALWGTLTAQVVMDMPLEEMRAYFGAWAGDASAVGESQTRWALGGRTHQEMLDPLAWIPEGVGYVIEGDADFLAFVREASERMFAAAAGAPIG